jgi:hypothetical protein
MGLDGTLICCSLGTQNTEHRTSPHVVHGTQEVPVSNLGLDTDCHVYVLGFYQLI